MAFVFLIYWREMQLMEKNYFSLQRKRKSLLGFIQFWPLLADLNEFKETLAEMSKEVVEVRHQFEATSVLGKCHALGKLTVMSLPREKLKKKRLEINLKNTWNQFYFHIKSIQKLGTFIVIMYYRRNDSLNYINHFWKRSDISVFYAESSHFSCETLLKNSRLRYNLRFVCN